MTDLTRETVEKWVRIGPHPIKYLDDFLALARWALDRDAEATRLLGLWEKFRGGEATDERALPRRARLISDVLGIEDESTTKQTEAIFDLQIRAEDAEAKIAEMQGRIAAARAEAEGIQTAASDDDEMPQAVNRGRREAAAAILEKLR